MGLDWVPMNKPKPGKESEFEEILCELIYREPPNFFPKEPDKISNSEELLRRFRDNSITAYETLNAPKIGSDESADKWAKDNFNLLNKDKLPLETFLESMKDYFVLDLVPACDGLPVYVSPVLDKYAFRAKCLDDCEKILGKKLHLQAWGSMFAKEALEYGKQIMKIAENYAKKNNCMHLKEQRIPPEKEERTPESNAHILFSAAKWLIFWAERNHGYEVDF